MEIFEWIKKKKVDLIKLKRMESKESYSVTSDYTIIDKATVAKQDGTGTETDIQINGIVKKAQK